MPRQYCTYILTNWNRSVLYTGVTNNLPIRIVEHYIGKADAFTTRYNAFYAVWYRETKYILNAIALEKEIKKYTRAQKEALVAEFNPEWRFLNEELLGNWPPNEAQIAEAKSRSEIPNPNAPKS